MIEHHTEVTEHSFDNDAPALDPIFQNSIDLMKNKILFVMCCILDKLNGKGMTTPKNKFDQIEVNVQEFVKCGMPQSVIEAYIALKRLSILVAEHYPDRPDEVSFEYLINLRDKDGKSHNYSDKRVVTSLDVDSDCFVMRLEDRVQD